MFDSFNWFIFFRWSDDTWVHVWIPMFQNSISFFQKYWKCWFNRWLQESKKIAIRYIQFTKCIDGLDFDLMNTYGLVLESYLNVFLSIWWHLPSVSGTWWWKVQKAGKWTAFLNFLIWMWWQLMKILPVLQITYSQ